MSHADLVVRAGRVVPEPGRSIAGGAVAIGRRSILAVGNAAEVDALCGAGTRVIDVPGGVVLPGLADAHGHLVSFGESLESLDLVGTRSVEDVVERVRAAAASLPGGAWIVGRGWDQNDWPEGERGFPDRARLDEAIGDRPVALTRVDGHALWASTAALGAAGLDLHASDPSDGRFERRADGALAGVLVDGAMVAVLRAVPAPSDEAIRRRAIGASRELARLGNTALHDMGSTLRVAELLLALGAEGALPVRLAVYLDAFDPAVWDAIAQGPRRRGLVSVVGVKFLLDGALGSRGAALLAPYEDDPAQSGLLLWDPDELRARAHTAMRAGLAVAVHAIGDRANRIAIDVLGDLAAEYPQLPRPRIEHAQIVAPEDLKRIGARGLVASMQPTHCTSDMPWTPARLGRERIRGAYAWRTIAEGGALLAFGSDCPIERPDPWAGLQAAVTRSADGAAFPPESERISLEQALAAYTTGAAAAIGEGDRRGTLREGADADLTVLENDPFGGDAITDARVACTIVDGRIAFRA